jgi:hypothetical protein
MMIIVIMMMMLIIAKQHHRFLRIRDPKLDPGGREGSGGVPGSRGDGGTACEPVDTSLNEKRSWLWLFFP